MVACSSVASIGAGGMTCPYGEVLNEVRGFPQAKDYERQLIGRPWVDHSCVCVCVRVCVRVHACARVCVGGWGGGGGGGGGEKLS